jgi:hypothetical protein
LELSLDNYYIEKVTLMLKISTDILLREKIDSYRLAENYCEKDNGQIRIMVKKIRSCDKQLAGN